MFVRAHDDSVQRARHEVAKNKIAHVLCASNGAGGCGDEDVGCHAAKWPALRRILANKLVVAKLFAASLLAAKELVGHVLDRKRAVRQVDLAALPDRVRLADPS